MNLSPALYKIDDKEIIEGCLAKNKFYEELLFERYRRYIKSICYRYCHNNADATDMMQETFIMIFEKLPSYAGRGAFSAWIQRLAINCSINYIRAKQTRVLYELYDDEEKRDLTKLSENYIYDKIDLKFYDKLIDKLPTSYQKVFRLYILEGYKHHEIAKELNISVGTTKSNLFKGKAHLKKLLQKNKIY
jgi:RNA polymerase sigma-70 factor (ECF subfamily)